MAERPVLRSVHWSVWPQVHTPTQENQFLGLDLSVLVPAIFKPPFSSGQRSRWGRTEVTGTSHQHSGCLRVSLVSSELWAQIVLSLRCCLSPSCTLVCAHMLCMRMIARSRDMCTCACVVCMQVYACVYCECMCTLRVCAHVHMWESECECWVGPGEMCLNGESWAHTFCLRPNHMEFHIFTHLARGNLPRLSQLKKKTPKSLSSLPLRSPLCFCPFPCKQYLLAPRSPLCGAPGSQSGRL